jgi:predicted TIM-barrel fold metal-dependent hydrolase
MRAGGIAAGTPPEDPMPVTLSPDELAQLACADERVFRSPIPTRPMSSDEFMPAPRTARQREFEQRVKRYGRELGAHQGLSRRRFFQTASGMAAAFLAMNDTYGPLFGVSRAEAATPEMAGERAARLSGQFIMDMHTHFLHDQTRLAGFVRSREAVGRAGWNPALTGREQTLEDLKFANYHKEVFLDSDTKVALVSGSASFDPADWFLSNAEKRDARERINRMAGGTRRALSHLIFTPGVPGALARFETELAELKPDSIKGYTIGDNTNKPMAKWPWRMDDEQLAYPYYERALKAGIRNVCVHKGLFPPHTERQYPHLLGYCDVGDVPRAARDWPQLNFIIYHSAYRFAAGGRTEDAWAQVQRSGRVEWVSDLAEIPARHGVNNVYGDLGQIFAQSTMADPNLAAFLMGTLLRGLGADRVVWGTDAIWTGSPQWQIEALRRLEIPEAMQRQYGFAPLGAADGPVKSAIFGGNNARLYDFTPAQRAALSTDRLAQSRAAYEAAGTGRSNLVYGYARRADTL